MKQYNAIKAKYPNTILLFRVGDFYETFGEDAILASKTLGIILTKRANGSASHIELAGFPHHSLDTYLPKFIKSGLRVAICEQLEEPQKGKVVRRGVTELLSPGAVLNDKMLEQNKNNYLASCIFMKNEQVALAFLELSTGEFFCIQTQKKSAHKMLNALKPSEVLIARQDYRQFIEDFGDQFYLFRLENWIFEKDFAYEKLIRHFQTESLKGFGIEENAALITASGTILHYLQENEHKNLTHIDQLRKFDDSEYLDLDAFTIRNLELIYPNSSAGKAFVDVLDYTNTPMGARLLKNWIVFPLKDEQKINFRLNVIESFLKNHDTLLKIQTFLKEIGDLERLVSKVATMRLRPKETQHLKNALHQLPHVVELLQRMQGDNILELLEGFADVSEVVKLLENSLQDEVPTNISDGNVIRDGISQELDELRKIKFGGEQYLHEMVQAEIERTGISSLKIGFNKVFGYYLEVRNTHKDKVPENFIRKQTLTNAERYITEELKVYEDKILNAEERIFVLETNLYTELLEKLLQYVAVLKQNAQNLAKLDVFSSFTQVSIENKYTKPIFSSENQLLIKNGRHPVIEKTLPEDSPYVPNDVEVNQKDSQILIITGPNMAGKSALLRQVALIALMAQIGCYVSADACEMSILDKIFVRVGASDNISGGESTFMVEMNESANIMNNATQNSLVLLDEIGRGTSTYDGVSIAWAIVEFLHNHEAHRAKTLFATHYHELNELENRLDRVKNFNVSVKEMDGKILFLRKLKPGGSEHSFGINVASMAGMPKYIVERAEELLHHFEQNRLHDKEVSKGIKFSERQNIQLNMFELKDEDTLRIRQILSGVDVNRLTPIEALLKLQEIQKALLGNDE